MLDRIGRVVVLLQPVFFGLGAVLARAVALPTSAPSLVRPLIAIAVIALVSLGVLRLLTRSWDWAALMASAFILFSLREAVIGLALAMVGVWWLAISALRRWGGRAQPSPSIPKLAAQAVGVFSVAFLASWTWSAWQEYDVAHAFTYPEYQLSGDGGPNIYLVLLDGYPRADTLRETFEYENSAFESELSDLGFTVSDAARSSYNKTWLTLPSMLNGTYVDRILPPEDAADAAEEIHWLRGMINEATMLDGLRDRGYVVRTIPSAFRSVDLESADDYIDHGHLNEFEAHLISYSPWSLLVPDLVRDWFASEQRAIVTDSLATTVRLARERDSQPQFVFTHVHSPHTPFVFHPDGSAPPPESTCFPGACGYWHATIEELGLPFNEYARGIRAQVEVLNEVVLSTVREIVDADPEAVIVLWSDHGSRYSLNDLPEHYRSFLAARSPGVDCLYPQDESPVNLLRRIFDAYLDADLGPLPFEAWRQPWGAILGLELVTSEPPSRCE